MVDLKLEQVINFIKSWPIVVPIVALVILFLVVNIRGRTVNNTVETVKKTDYYQVEFNTFTKTYDIELNNNFYDRDESEILNDVESIGNEYDILIDVPMILYPTTDKEKENLENVDPYSGQPGRAYPGD